MTKTAPKNKAASALANTRWKKTKSPEARRAATAAATAARWPRCVHCGERKEHTVHDWTSEASERLAYTHSFKK